MKIYQSLDDPEVAKSLSSGEVGVMPTDTVIGLVCIAKNAKSVNKIHELKQRSNKPGTIIGANVDQLHELGIPRRYLKAVEQFWPGPVSVESLFPSDPFDLTMSRGHIAVRIPDDTKLLELLEKVGPLMTSSANISGQPTCETIQECIDAFGDKVDFYIRDENEANKKSPSALIKIVDDEIVVIRPGYNFS